MKIQLLNKTQEKTEQRKTKLSITLLIAATMLVTGLLSPISVSATTKEETRTVKVGWYHSENFQEGMDDSSKTGYSYDYLQKVANYSGWTYEYVYGDWTDLLQKLETGEIDVMAGVSDTKEREAYLLFPESEMGNESYYVFIHRGDESIRISENTSFSGKKVATIKNTLMETFTKEWIEESHLDIELVTCDSFDECEELFDANLVDMVVETDNNVVATGEMKPLVIVGKEPFYLAVSAEKPEILKELNQALTILNEVEPYYLQNILLRYYGKTAINSTLSNRELDWIGSHPSIRVGYLDNYLPFSTTNQMGQVIGVLPDVLDEIGRKLEIQDQVKKEYVAYNDYGDMMEDLLAGKIDLAFPVGGDQYDINQRGIHVTNEILTTNLALVVKGSFDRDRENTFAVNKHNDIQVSNTKKYFPDAIIKEYETVEQCADAVLAGEADATIINGLRTDIISKNTKYKELTVYDMGISQGRDMAVRAENTELLILLNRGLNIIGTDFGVNASYQYVNDLYEVTLFDILISNLGIVALVAIGIVGLMVMLFINNLSKKQERLQYEQAQNEKLREAHDRADRASKAKTTFLFNMSHDIRTPMNAIIGFTDLLEKNLEDKEKAEDYIKKIKDSNAILLSLVNNVLEMARIESGRMELNIGYCKGDELAKSVFTVFSEDMKRKNLRFTNSLNIKHNDLMCDQTKVREIFINLISNAYKYTPEGGSVHLEADEIESHRKGYGLFRITVTDTGIGMADDFVDHIFDEFSRERTSTESRVEGSGLGMAIVKRLVELMDGAIKVESALDRGTKITVMLPIRFATEEEIETANLPAPAPVEEKNVLEDARILLAEDNDLNAEIAITLLEVAGCKVERAEDGVECYEMLEKAESDYYDLILMDIQMPNLNGYEASKLIRQMADQKKANIPIIALTANAFEEDKKDAINAGMNDHMTKPIKPKELTQKMSEYVKK